MRESAPAGTRTLYYPAAHCTLEFAIDTEGRQVWANWTGECQERSITALLVGPVLGAVLRLRGRVSLHGCVLEVGARAVVLLGHSRSGKSTLAAAMAERGHAVLADDVAALAENERDGWRVDPGYPRLRVEPGTAAALTDPPPDGGPVLWGSDKRYLELGGTGLDGRWRFQPDPLPLAAIYEVRRARDVAIASTEPVAGGERLAALLRHRRTVPGTLAAAKQAAEFERLGRLARSTRIRRLDCPDDLAALPEVCSALADDVTSPR